MLEASDVVQMIELPGGMCGAAYLMPQKVPSVFTSKQR